MITEMYTVSVSLVTGGKSIYESIYNSVYLDVIVLANRKYSSIQYHYSVHMLLDNKVVIRPFTNFNNPKAYI